MFSKFFKNSTSILICHFSRHFLRDWFRKLSPNFSRNPSGNIRSNFSKEKLLHIYFFCQESEIEKKSTNFLQKHPKVASGFFGITSHQPRGISSKNPSSMLPNIVLYFCAISEESLVEEYV